jgi:hypothetical protein
MPERGRSDAGEQPSHVSRWRGKFFGSCNLLCNCNYDMPLRESAYGFALRAQGIPMPHCSHVSGAPSIVDHRRSYALVFSVVWRFPPVTAGRRSIAATTIRMST